MIKLSHIRKSFAGRCVLDDISFSIAEREMVCIIGSVGCGKSTLLRCMAGLETPDSGEITFTNSEHQTNVGMVFQRFNLFPHLNVLHNLTLAPVKVHGVSSSEAERSAREQLDSVGLWQKSNSFPHELSMGQQQRVAIARSLVMKPKVLLLDEPLASLDPIAVGEVVDVLRKLKKEITLVMITHQLNVAAELADRIIFLNNGKICEEGSPDEVISNPKQEATRKFLSHLKNLHYIISAPQFDRPELNARVEQYCNRFGFGSQAFRFVQLAVEELLNIIPLDKGAKLMLSKVEQQVRMSLEVRVPNVGCNYLDENTCRDDLSLSLLQGLCDVIEEYVEGDERILHLELDQERLLLK